MITLHGSMDPKQPCQPKLFVTIDGKEYLYNPKITITAFQLAKLHLLFEVATRVPFPSVSMTAFVVDNGLLEHFDLKDPGV